MRVLRFTEGEYYFSRYNGLIIKATSNDKTGRVIKNGRNDMYKTGLIKQWNTSAFIMVNNNDSIYIPDNCDMSLIEE